MAWRLVLLGAIAIFAIGGLYQWRESAVSVGIAETKTVEYKGMIQRKETVERKREGVRIENTDTRREVDKLSAGAIADEFLRDWARSN